MKVIFLDFDGVINNWYSSDKVDIVNVRELKKIVNSTGALIVATSSNKYSFQERGIKYEDSNYFEYVKELEKYGINVFDVTPYVNQNREAEIMEYLRMHPEVEQYLILDDDGVWKNLLEHQVFLDLDLGIREEHVDVAIDILNGKLGFYPYDFNFNETLGERSIIINKYHKKRR